MERRRFFAYLCGVPLATYGAVVLSSCSDERGELSTDLKARRDAGAKFQSFAYYQGLGPNETRDPGRTDGTSYSMPCITAVDIAAGVEKIYDFWHGHDGMQHKFTVTSADFAKLKAGHETEIYTSVVEDHRHSLLLSPTRPCESKRC